MQFFIKFYKIVCRCSSLVQDQPLMHESICFYKLVILFIKDRRSPNGWNALQNYTKPLIFLWFAGWYLSVGMWYARMAGLTRCVPWSPTPALWPCGDPAFSSCLRSHCSGTRCLLCYENRIYTQSIGGTTSVHKSTLGIWQERDRSVHAVL